MMHKILFTGLLLLCTLLLNAQNPILPSGFAQVPMADSLNPTAMVFDHHGNLFLAQKDGRVLLLTEDGQLLPDPVLTIPVDDFNERGIAGIVLHPDFDDESWLYLYYTVQDSGFNRVSRFLINGQLAVPGSEEILFNFDKLNSGIHNGGSMIFGQDGKLYIGTGDGGKSSNAQALNVTLGKIIRLHADGTIPIDNPFYSELTGQYRAIYAYGLRNPFSIAMDPVSGRIFVSDVGQGAFEEVNEVLPHKNYGWNAIEGPISTQTPPLDYQDPYFAYPHATGCAIVGAAIYAPDGQMFPFEYIGKYFFADYCNGLVKILDLDTGLATDTFASGLKQPVAFAVNHDDGSFWYLMRSGIGGGSQIDNTSTKNGSLWKVFYTGSGAPFISVDPSDALLPVGEQAQFKIQVFGAQPMHFRWQKNGLDLPNSDSLMLHLSAVELSDDGAEFRCIAENAAGADTSDTAVLQVRDNQRPVPEIAIPAPGTLYRAGDLIQFAGTAVDPEDGPLSATQLHWRVDFHHDTHTHPALATQQGVSNGSFIIPTAGETSANTWYRIYLRAVDMDGFEQEVYRDIHPALTSITVSGPPGLNVNIDGILRPMPHTFVSLQRQDRILQAFEEVIHQDTIFLFEKWAESTDNSVFFNFSAPDTMGLELHALYSSYALGNGTGLHGEYFVDPEFDLDEAPVALRLDTVVNFNWGNGAPFPNLIPDDGYTVRWSGFVQPYFSENYSFHVKSDDGCRLWINDSLIIDKWVAQSSMEHSGTIMVAGGAKIPIRLEYLEIGGGADISLQWSSEHTSKAIVPKRQLYPIPAYEPATLRGTVWHDLNYDGIIDSNEPLLKNSTVLLFSGDTTLLSTGFSNATGQYKFSGLTAGNYFIRVIPAPEYHGLLPFLHLDPAGQSALLTLGPLESLQWHVSFISQPASIAGRSFKDENKNGAFDLGEPLLEGVSVLLFQAEDTLLLDVKLTNNDGQFVFDFLSPGQYFLHFYNSLNNQNLIPAPAFIPGGFSDLILLSQSDGIQYDAPFISQPGQVLSQVWLDANGNYFPDFFESGIENVTVLLYTQDSLLVSAGSTGPGGQFLFDQVTPGLYFLWALSNTVPLSLEPSFGINANGQTPMFEVFEAATRSLELGFKPNYLAVYSTQKMDLVIWPNPVSAELFVKGDKPFGSAFRGRIRDVSGRVVKVIQAADISSTLIHLDVRTLTAGLYFIELENQYGRLIRRFIKG